MDERRIPQGRLGRLARLAALGARTGAGLLTGRAAGGAAQAAEVLGTLRGLAAKVGQMASYVDGLVPEQHRDTFEAQLAKLRAGAARSSPGEVRAVVEAELGQSLESAFARWEAEPMASASIGQVHAAVLPDGREVAVKVQHPGVAAAVESDLANAGIIELLAGAAGARRFDSKAMLETVRERFREELDYRREADNLLFFADLHRDDPTIRLPELVATHSARRVLTTTLIRGASFEEACAADEDDRRRWAETLWRFVFKGNLVGGRFNADPHPGNYFFHPGGRVTFIDHGCVQPIPDETRTKAVAIHHAALARDQAAFFHNVSRMLDARPGRLDDAARSYMRDCFAPLFESPFLVTRPYAAALLGKMKGMAVLARDLPPDEFFTMPASMIFINRLQFGFYSLLARLAVPVDYEAVERAFLPPAAPAASAVPPAASPPAAVPPAAGHPAASKSASPASEPLSDG